MTRPRLLATLVAIAAAIIVYVVLHHLAHPSVGADIAIMGAVILILAVLPRYLANKIKRSERPTDHSSHDLPVS